MKKFCFCFLAAFLLLGLNGCGNGRTIFSIGTGNQSGQADGGFYRGTLISMTKTKSGWELELEQVKGTAFGDPQMKFLLTPESSTSFDEEELEIGVYVEVYYNQKQEILSADLYSSAEVVVFNGTLRSFQQDQPGVGRMVLVRDGSGEEAVFGYDEGRTHFYIPREELEEGMALSIFHSGNMTRSIPPQGNALEVRLQAEDFTAEEGD